MRVVRSQVEPNHRWLSARGPGRFRFTRHAPGRGARPRPSNPREREGPEPALPDGDPSQRCACSAGPRGRVTERATHQAAGYITERWHRHPHRDLERAHVGTLSGIPLPRPVLCAGAAGGSTEQVLPRVSPTGQSVRMRERSRKPGDPVQPEPPFFIFDGECGFCRKWAAWLGKRLPPRTLLVAFQQIDDLAAFGLAESEVNTASYWIDADGTAHGGADSFAYALRGTGLPWGPLVALMRAPVLPSEPASPTG